VIVDEPSGGDLESAYRIFALQALAVLRREKRAGRVRQSALGNYAFPGEDQLSYDFVLEPSASDYHRSLVLACQSGALTNAVSTCLAQHSSTLLSKLSWYENSSDPPPDVGVSHEDGERNALLWPIARAMAQHTNRKVTIDHVLEEYRHAIQSWQAQSVHRHVIIPLLHFNGVGASLELSGDIKVAPLTRKEKEFIVNNAFRHLVPGLSSPLDLSSLWIATHKVEFTYEKKIEHVSEQELRDTTASRIRPLIVALRLWKPGRVGTAGAIVTSAGPFLHPSQTYYIPLQTDTYASPVSQYRLASQERRSFRTFYTETESIFNKSGFLKSALESFSRSYRDQPIESAVVDLAVALESALVDDAAEISYKFRMRGGAVGAATKLTDLEFDPMSTRDLLNLLYIARSKIVHAGERLEDIKQLTRPDKTRYDAHAFLDQSQACVRSLLKRMVIYLSEPKNANVLRDKQEWVRQLDKALLIN